MDDTEQKLKLKLKWNENQESSKDGSNLLHENYLKLKDIAEGILNERYRYMKLNAPGFMDLIIEQLGDNRISLSHYYIQNGDLMADPDMEIIVDHENQTLTAATFQQDNMGIYHESYRGEKLVDEDLEGELNEFLKDWLQNISAQGHIPYKAYYADGIVTENEEPVFDEMGHEINNPNLSDEEDLEI